MIPLTRLQLHEIRARAIMAFTPHFTDQFLPGRRNFRKSKLKFCTFS